MPTPHSDLMGKLVRVSGCSVVGCCPDLIGIVMRIDTDGMVTLLDAEGHDGYADARNIREVWGDPGFQQPLEGIQ